MFVEEQGAGPWHSISGAGPRWSAGLSIVGLFAVLVSLAYASRRKLLFPAPRPLRAPVTPPGSLLHADTAAGRLVALWLAPGPGAPVVVHFHGNGEQLADVAVLARQLHARGVGVLAIEYPGYGLRGGESPSESALYEAAEAALTHLRGELGIPPERTILQGHSLGSGVAAELAQRGRGAGLVLLSPYTSIPDVAARIVPFLPVRWLLDDRFATADKAPSIRIPVQIIHGELDALIPPAMGRRLAGLFPDARLELLPGVHHNDLFLPPHGPALLDRIAAFACRVAGPRGA
jgi:hypothetical protein